MSEVVVFLVPNQPPPMPDVRDDIPHALSAVSSTANAAGLASEAAALKADCVTTPLSEHLPGLLRTGIPYPSGGDAPAGPKSGDSELYCQRHHRPSTPTMN
jgi:hypothetical protein